MCVKIYNTKIVFRSSTIFKIIYFFANSLFFVVSASCNSFWMGLSFVAEISHCLFSFFFFSSFSTSSSCNIFFVYERHISCISTNLFDSFLRFSLIYKQWGGGVAIWTAGSGTFISCSWSGNTAPTDKVSTIVSILLLSPSLDQPFISSRQSWYIYNINPKKYQKRFWIFSLILFTFQITKFHLLSLETIPFPYNY